MNQPNSHFVQAVRERVAEVVVGQDPDILGSKILDQSTGKFRTHQGPAPEQIAPFSAVACLRRVQCDCATKLDGPARQSLSLQVFQEIEAAYFRGASASANAPDLQAIVQKWWQVAR